MALTHITVVAWIVIILVALGYDNLNIRFLAQICMMIMILYPCEAGGMIVNTARAHHHPLTHSIIHNPVPPLHVIRPVAS